MPSIANQDGCNPRGASLERIMTSALDLGVHALRAAYRGGTLTCRKVVEARGHKLAEPTPQDPNTDPSNTVTPPMGEGGDKSSETGTGTTG